MLSSPKNDDITRLLDPAYSSKATRLLTHTSLYVDNHGDYHDPDFRAFPQITHRRYTRPRWELNDEDDDDSNTILEDDHYSIKHHYRPSSSSSRFTTSPQRSYPSPLFSSAHLVSHPTSFDSDNTVFDDEYFSPSSSPFSDEKEKERMRSFIPKCRRTSWSKEKERSTIEQFSHYADEPEEIHQHEDFSEEDHQQQQQQDHDQESQEEWVPTCTQSLKRQWQAISLRLRFSLFRAQRRVKRRVNSIL